MSKFQTISAQGTDVSGGNYQVAKQYIDVPDTMSGRKPLHTYMRKRAVMGRWEILEKLSYC